MTITITRENFTEALEKAVAEKGKDYVYEHKAGYETCLYTHDGKTGACLIGKALEILGVDMGRYEGNTHATASMVLEDLGVTDEMLLKAAWQAQSCQDYGDSWGKSLKIYKEILKNGNTN